MGRLGCTVLNNICDLCNAITIMTKKFVWYETMHLSLKMYLYFNGTYFCNKSPSNQTLLELCVLFNDIVSALVG